MNPFAGQQWKSRHGEQIFGHNGGRKGWAKLREQYGNTLPYVKQAMEIYGVKQGAQTGAL